MRSPILIALALATLTPLLATAVAQRSGVIVRPPPPPPPPPPIPLDSQRRLEPLPPLPPPPPIMETQRPLGLAPAPLAPATVVRPPPPPQCSWVETCASQAGQCLASHLVSSRYEVRWRDGWPRITPNPDNRSDAAEQAADDCADNLRQCLTGC
jgi:hypothetical protein